MTNKLTELVTLLDESGVVLQTQAGRSQATRATLFHLPAVALAVLVGADESPGPVTTGEVPHLVASCFEAAFPDLVTANRQLKWSLPLGRSCADALVFLELVKLIDIIDDESVRRLRTSAKGRGFLRRKGMSGGFFKLVAALREGALNYSLTRGRLL